MKYDVTIGIPVYRSEAYIQKTLESALAQTYPSIQYLIVDDGGGDDSINIIREIKETHSRGQDICIVSHQKNLGVSTSRNRIIDEAQGEYLYFLDSDDRIEKQTIALLMQNIRQYDAEIAFGSYEKIDISGKKTVYQYPSLQLLKENELACFAYRKYGGIQASACNYLVKTSVLRNHHLRFVQADYWEDMVFTFDLVPYISRAVLLPDITYSYICRENSLSRYQERSNISKDEILQNIQTIHHLKETSSILYNKVYFPHRCNVIVMTDFYIACHVLKRKRDIVPPVSNHEIKAMMAYPATFSQVCSFRQSRFKSLLLFLLGELPSSLCVASIWIMAKSKKLL